jgi:hypothetical protein
VDPNATEFIIKVLLQPIDREAIGMFWRNGNGLDGTGKGGGVRGSIQWDEME